MKNPAVTIGSLAVVGVAAAIFLMPIPQGASPKLFEAGALSVLIVGFWALGTMPEHIVGLLFFLLAMLFAIAPASVVFSGFASGTLWLVLGGLVTAEAVNVTRLGERFARFLIGRYMLSYRTLIAATVLVSTALCFVMPATVSRILLLLPIMVALAQRLGLAPGSRGHDGVALAVIMTNVQVGISILPANAPNLVLAGAAETLYSTPLIYGEWLLVHFPVMGVLKGLLIIGFIWLLFPDETTARAEAAPAQGPMSRAERRLTIILLLALALWATDFMHRIHPGWIGLAAGLATLVPIVGVMPVTVFTERVKFGPFFYIAAILGLGAVMVHTGLSTALGDGVLENLKLQGGEDAKNFAILTLLSTFTGVIVTNVAQPALLTPLASHLAEVVGWPLKAVLMTIVLGCTTVVLPFQTPPAVVGMQIAGLKMRTALRLTVPLALASLLVLLPLDYWWWRALDYFATR